MEQNIQEQTAGSGGYLLRRGLGTAGQGHCIAALARQGSHPDFVALEAFMRQCPGPVVACYVLEKSISHYGMVDQLAPAGAMEEFVAHVQAEHWEEARHIFAPLHSELECGRAELHVLTGCKAWNHALTRLEKLFEQVHVFQPVA